MSSTLQLIYHMMFFLCTQASCEHSTFLDWWPSLCIDSQACYTCELYSDCHFGDKHMTNKHMTFWSELVSRLGILVALLAGENFPCQSEVLTLSKMVSIFKKKHQKTLKIEYTFLSCFQSKKRCSTFFKNLMVIFVIITFGSVQQRVMKKVKKVVYLILLRI